MERRRVEVAPGTLLREAVRAVGQTPEGSAVLRAGRPVPLDLPLESAGEFELVPTFSGG